MDIFGWIFLALFGTIVWPFNIPLMALAYKARIGQQPVPFETLEYWLRSGGAALALAILGWIFLPLYLLMFLYFGIPELIGLMVLSMVYLPAAAGLLYWIFACDELVEAVSLTLIYLFLPGLPLVFLGWLTGLGKAAARYVS